MDPTVHYKMKARQLMMDLVTGLQTRHEHRAGTHKLMNRRDHGKHENRNRQLSALIVNIETVVQAE